MFIAFVLLVVPVAMTFVWALKMAVNSARSEALAAEDKALQAGDGKLAARLRKIETRLGQIHEEIENLEAGEDEK